MGSRGVKPSIALGSKFLTNCGMYCEVTEYYNASEILVRFEDGYEKVTSAQSLRNGWIKNPYFRSKYGVGFLGEGIFEASVGRKDTQEYKNWSKVLFRCYSEDILINYPSYSGCVTNELWHNFQNFAAWCQTAVGFSLGWCLDKDLLVKGNKVYGPDTCVFLPPRVNTLLVKPVVNKKLLPTGVVSKGRNYVAQVNNGVTVKNLGTYTTSEEAFYKYKVEKESIYRSVAEEWKGIIDTRAYNALYNRTVEITD